VNNPTCNGPKYDKRLAATDLGREYIPQIYDMVIAGHSLADVCEWLDSLHLWQKLDPDTGELTDVPWWPTRLADLIRSLAYRGALIDARRFRLTNDALAGREKRGPRGEPQARVMLKGAIKCPDCEGGPRSRPSGG
jgi:hypothetical protein